MEKKIIALQGKSGTGKTTTLKLLIDKIASIYPTKTVHKNNSDIAVIADIDGKTVGITTRGDNEECLAKDFEYMGLCDLYICACRTKGESVDFLESEANGGLLIYHGKWYVSAKIGNLKNISDIRNGVNSQQVDEIYKELLSLL